jgi:hypothetical protein
MAVAPTRVRGSRSTGHAVELWEVERPCPLQSALHEHLELRRDQLGAIETAELHENDAREALQVVGVQPGSADWTEDAIETFARTCFGSSHRSGSSGYLTGCFHNSKRAPATTIATRSRGPFAGGEDFGPGKGFAEDFDDDVDEFDGDDMDIEV